MELSYSDKRYWDKRYATYEEEESARGEPFDWLCAYEDLDADLKPYLEQAVTVLDVGCGNSNLAQRLSQTNSNVAVFGVDYSTHLFSEEAIPQEVLGGVGMGIMDARQLGFRDASFDLVIDKGCMDSLLNDHDQVKLKQRWGRQITPEQQRDLDIGMAAGLSMLHEIWRVLRPCGVFFMVSYEPPGGRMHLLQDSGLHGVEDPCPWEVLVSGEEHTTGNYIYVLRRPGDNLQ